MIATSQGNVPAVSSLRKVGRDGVSVKVGSLLGIFAGAVAAEASSVTLESLASRRTSLNAPTDNAAWRCTTYTLERATSAETDIHDLTAEVAARVADADVSEGNVVVFTPGSTASVSTIEYEPGAVADLADAIERIAPRELRYAHNERWGDGNGYSHVRSALLGPSITVPIADGELMLGTWQQIVLIDFDNRPRRRKVLVQVNGR